MSDPMSDALKNVGGIISTLEKSLEVKTTLLLYNFVVFLDCCLLIINGQGIIQITTNSVNLSFSFAVEILLLFLLFSAFMNMVMVFIDQLFSFIFNEMLYSLWLKVFPHRDRVKMWASGYVNVSQISSKADETKEIYYINLAKEAGEKEKELINNLLYIKHQLVAAFSISTFNLLYNFNPRDGSLLKVVSKWITENCQWAGGHGYIVTCIFVAGLFMAALSILFYDYDHYEYCRPLAKEWDDTRRANERRSSVPHERGKNTDF